MNALETSVKESNFCFLDTIIYQNTNSISSYLELFQYIGAKEFQIIELGTAAGGFSLMLRMLSKKEYCKKFTTIDYKDYLSKQIKIHFLLNDINFICDDIFSGRIIDFVKKEIQNPITTVLICDNGNKIQEFKIFSDYLKVGDIITCHDYAKSQEYFDSNIKSKIWNHAEIKYDDIVNSAERNNLEPLLEDIMASAAFGCFEKKK